MKVAFEPLRLRRDSLELGERCNEVVEAYQAMNLRLTLRQLYYQLVTKNIIANTEKQYKRLSQLVTSARMQGLMDWDAIEDRVRVPRYQSEWGSVEELMESAFKTFRLPRWEGQEYYAELWVEKDALAGVLQPLAREYHVTMMVNRGYSSASAMYEAANRYKSNCEDRHPVLFYLGDLDPSGEDMVRDIRERLHVFGIDVDVRKIALTYDQVLQYQPPPNPAKITDPRAMAYIAKFGQSSWEVDALPPPVLSSIIHKALKSVVDADTMDQVMYREAMLKTKMRALIKEAGI